MELMFIIVQQADYEGLSRQLIRNRIPATKFTTEGLYLNKKNITLMICIEKEREEEIFGYIRNNCTKRMEARQLMEYNGMFMEQIVKQVEVGGATVITVPVGEMKRF